MLWFNRWSQTREHWENGDTRHDWMCLTPAAVESRVFPWKCSPTAWLNSLPAFCATFSCFQVLWTSTLFLFFNLTFMKVFVQFYFTNQIWRDINVCQPAHEPRTILKLSQMHEIGGDLHTDALWRDLCCDSERQANRSPAPPEPVPTHQRYHSDFSSSSESPSVTSSDPDYGQGRSR